MSYRLNIYLDVGNEDGPAFYYTIIPYIGPSYPKIQVKSEPAEGIWLTYKIPFLNVFDLYHIEDVIEIHDWYDYLDEKEIAKQEALNNVALISASSIPIGMIIIVPYNLDPGKYLVPLEIYDTFQLDVLKEEGYYYEKQKLLDRLRSYRVFAPLYDILSKRKILKFKSEVSDEMIHKLTF